MERIKNMSLHPLRVEEDFGFQKLVVAETEKLPLADIQPGHTARLPHRLTTGSPCRKAVR
jgi:hypothetical protein